MELNTGSSRFLAPVLLTALLAGCAAPRLADQDADPFPVQAAEETFSVGYANISDKFIDRVLIGDLALEGMRGLGALDPALTVRRDADSIVLASAAADVARFPAPAADDTEAWAHLTVEVSKAGRQTSNEVRNATVEDVYEAVFDGLLSKLDRYSRYAGRDEARRNRAKREGFGGIGIRFQALKGKVRVTDVMEGTPAERAGLEVNDLIVQVDGVAISEMPSTRIVDLLRGPIDTFVRLSVRRGDRDALLDFDIERAHVVPTTVTEKFEGGVLFLTVSRFNQATVRSMSRKIKKTRRKHGESLKGVVLDMRGNPGGLLKQAIRAADLFLTQGEILKTRGRHPDSLQYYQARGSDLARGLPVVVLVDGKSASAAEITAAALQDRGRAVVIGTTSFGKGTVQTVIRLPNDGEITLTWSRFVAPSGYVINKLGVRPTVCTSVTAKSDIDRIRRVLDEKNQAVAVLSAWRTVATADEARKTDLRASCPPQRRNQRTDLQTARILVEDSSLYSRLLGLSNTAAAAAHH
ncbi:MAG: S41 family peptidase [Rhodospirillales bacterium]|nr:S41 family peptidase [Rhodospirillales bacterium]